MWGSYGEQFVNITHSSHYFAFDQDIKSFNQVLNLVLGVKSGGKGNCNNLSRQIEIVPCRRNLPLFGNVMSSIKKGVSGGGGMEGPNTLNVNSVGGAHGGGKISPSNHPDYAAQNSFRKMPDE